jgi:STAM-binding protein
MAGSTLQVSKPMNVKEIASKAQSFEFNLSIALKYWLRTADTLLREAHIYEEEENDQQAYLLLMRYAALVAEKLPLHPAARELDSRQALKAARQTLPDVITRLEILKPRIEARYTVWQTALERRKNASEAVDNDRSRSKSHVDFAASDPALASNSKTLAAAEHGDLAVKLAHKEIKRRDAARKATRQAGISEEEEQERRTAGLWDDWENALNEDGQHGEDEEIRQRIEATRRRIDGSHDMVPGGVKRSSTKPLPKVTKPPQPTNSSEYRYPSISKPQPLKYDDRKSESQRTSIALEGAFLPPKPPKERYDDQIYDGSVPARPDKATPEPSQDEAMNGKVQLPSYTFRPSAYLENGSPLRTVFLPPTLREKFLSIAATNTRANLETCGILCGTLISNALFISHLVIPEQKSTSDTCETVNESALFDYCDSEDLMVLGWIHTHPSQTCFMSSRDLHTHCGYQVMMPESIAIVCAPSKNPSYVSWPGHVTEVLC